jgi:hypothetical protein
MLKEAFEELDPVTDCIGRVTAFEYVILEGQMEAMEMGAVMTLIPNKYQQSSNSSVSGSQVQDSKMTQNAYC